MQIIVCSRCCVVWAAKINNINVFSLSYSILQSKATWLICSRFSSKENFKAFLGRVIYFAAYQHSFYDFVYVEEVCFIL